jgi:uncharacterized protein (DUF433 family)
MTAVTTSHIVLDDHGKAYVDGTRTSVSMIVMDKMNGLTPEQIHNSYPYITLAQIYAALAYYYDHQRELDAEIAADAVDIAQQRDRAVSTGTQPTRTQLETRAAQQENQP